jgi:hypothetical protein
MLLCSGGRAGGKWRLVALFDAHPLVGWKRVWYMFVSIYLVVMHTQSTTRSASLLQRLVGDGFRTQVEGRCDQS